MIMELTIGKKPLHFKILLYLKLSQLERFLRNGENSLGKFELMFCRDDDINVIVSIKSSLPIVNDLKF